MKKISTLLFLLQALLFTVFFQAFFYGNFKIPSGSMSPTLLVGDRIIVDKFSYGYSKYSLPHFINFDFLSDGKIFVRSLPQRGDVVVFAGLKYKNQKDFYIKRVIGLPGDLIFISNGEIFINKNKLEYNFLKLVKAKDSENENSFNVFEFEESFNSASDDTITKLYRIFIADKYSDANNTGLYIVPENHYFVMGDNRDNSLDSRFPEFSYIHFDRIIGKASFIYASLTPSDYINNITFKKRFSRIFKIIN